MLSTNDLNPKSLKSSQFLTEFLSNNSNNLFLIPRKKEQEAFKFINISPISIHSYSHKSFFTSLHEWNSFPISFFFAFDRSWKSIPFLCPSISLSIMSELIFYPFQSFLCSELDIFAFYRLMLVNSCFWTFLVISKRRFWNSTIKCLF